MESTIRILREVIRRLKEGKALRGNGILAQVRTYGLEEVKGWLWEQCNRIWKKEG